MFCPAWWSTWPPLGKLVAVTVIPAGTVRMVELIDELPFGVFPHVVHFAGGSLDAVDVVQVEFVLSCQGQCRRERDLNRFVG